MPPLQEMAKYIEPKSRLAPTIVIVWKTQGHNFSQKYRDDNGLVHPIQNSSKTGMS